MCETVRECVRVFKIFFVELELEVWLCGEFFTTLETLEKLVN
jgi:hypothetical protein